MTINRIFFCYMTIVGALTGAILIAVPSAGDGWFRPYFWVLVAVALFDVSATLVLRSPPGAALAMQTRLIGFGIGITLMVALPSIAGTPTRFF